MKRTEMHRTKTIGEQLKNEYGLKTSAEVVNLALDGYREGRDWVLRKYRCTDSPELKIGEHEGSMVGVNGFTETRDGKTLIGLQVSELRKLNRANSTTRIEEDYGSDIPVKPVLTISQWYESFGVEETLHWLQHRRVRGTTPLPKHSKRLDPKPGAGGGVEYLSQPHEFEGLVLRGKFFVEKYGHNPLADLEEYIQERCS